MALINCPECSSRVSSEAQSCPRCGYTLAKQGKAKKSGSGCGIGCLTIVILLVVIAIAGSLSNSGPNQVHSSPGVTVNTQANYPQVRYENDPDITSEEIVWIMRQKNNIKANLREPRSATFRNVLISRVTGAPVVLGEVNSKNAFGGYTGFTRFMVAEHIQFIEGADVPYDEFNRTWNTMVP